MSNWQTQQAISRANARLRSEREEREAQEAREREARKAENDRLRAEYLAGLEAERAERRRRDEEALDAELEPVKQRMKREWLANHPAATETDFERKAWPHLRANLLEDRREQLIARTQEQLRQTGMYRL